MKEEKTYNFGEKEKEFDSQTGNELPVWQTPKYKMSRKKAIEMIESNKYDLSEADFWILMNKTKKGKMSYTGLIISHNGCLKINEASDNKVNPKCFNLDKEGYNGSLVYTYIDEDTYEVGEYSKSNCSNSYPYAMAFKRCFDRVVLKKSKLAFSGIYSEVEADEFKENQSGEDSEESTIENYREELITYCKENKLDLKEISDSYNLSKTSTENDYKKAYEDLTK